MFLQDRLASKGVEPFHEEQSQLAVGHKVDVEERQEPVPDCRERPHTHDPPHHLVAARRSLPKRPVEPADEEVPEVDSRDVRAVREEEDEEFVVVELAGELCYPTLDRGRYEHLLRLAGNYRCRS